jgi:carboxypeptidase C (cathepsin A)
MGLFQEMGPCEIIQLPNGSYSTQPRLWGWDRSSNLLFIDQPTQVGFSFDERVNASVNLMNDHAFVPESRSPPQSVPANIPSWRWFNGTFASGVTGNTQDTTAIAAQACWHFLQGFLSTFPQYNPGTRPNSSVVEPAAVNLFAESYGGFYGPAFADFFEEQNDRRRNGSISDSSLEIRLGSVGIVNGMMDQLTQTISVANFTRDNTYGINAIGLVTFENAISEINSDTGCRGLVTRCRQRLAITDPEGYGRNEDTDALCTSALEACNSATGKIYEGIDKSPYDIRFKPEIGPGAAYQEYLNTADVMESIGAQVNFTQTSLAVQQAFYHCESFFYSLPSLRCSLANTPNSR